VRTEGFNHLDVLFPIPGSNSPIFGKPSQHAIPSSFELLSQNLFQFAFGKHTLSWLSFKLLAQFLEKSWLWSFE